MKQVILAGFTSHGLISFFHDLADGSVRNVIDHFQAD